MKSWRLQSAMVVALVLLGAVAVYFFAAPVGGSAEDMATPGGATGLAQASPASPMPAVVREESRRIEIVRPAPVPFRPPVVIEPLFEPNARVRINETANLQFAMRDRASGLPASGMSVTASVFHGNDAPVDLDATEVEDGVFQVPFTPQGPGQFNVVVSIDGVQAASRKIGVVGAVGVANGQVDIADPFLDVDPRTPRARTSGRTTYR